MIGIPATPEREQKIKQAAWSKLPEMRRQLRQLQRTVAAIIGQLPAAAQLELGGDFPPDVEDDDGHRAVA
jgi:hypothetical protein